MVYTDLTRKAAAIAVKAHQGQVDKGGFPYIFHPFHVADQMLDEISASVALLHDVVEDTSVTFDDLRKEGFPDSVLNPLKLLTHNKKVPYFDYIRNIKSDPVAIVVKLADLKHNQDTSRIPVLTAKETERLQKYKEAEKILKT